MLEHIITQFMPKKLRLINIHDMCLNSIEHGVQQFNRQLFKDIHRECKREHEEQNDQRT